MFVFCKFILSFIYEIFLYVKKVFCVNFEIMNSDSISGIRNYYGWFIMVIFLFYFENSFVWWRSDFLG